MDYRGNVQKRKLDIGHVRKHRPDFGTGRVHDFLKIQLQVFQRGRSRDDHDAGAAGRFTEREVGFAFWNWGIAQGHFCHRIGDGPGRKANVRIKTRSAYDFIGHVDFTKAIMRTTLAKEFLHRIDRTHKQLLDVGQFVFGIAFDDFHVSLFAVLPRFVPQGDGVLNRESSHFCKV